MNKAHSVGYNPPVQVFDFSSSVFGPLIRIPTSAKVIFVADMFAQDYVGGAELTTEALVETSPFDVFKLHSRDVTLDLLREGSDRFWVFGNFAQLNPQLIPTIAGNLRYSVLEYDYKYCAYRSPEKHVEATGMPCTCHLQDNGRLIAMFYAASKGMWWMSEAQKDRYLTAFPLLSDTDNIVLSSVFSRTTLGTITCLAEASPKPEDRTKWIVLGSNSWVKGADDAEAWCKSHGKDYEVVWNVPYDQLLEKLSKAKGFVYLPKGGDTCPRMVIEAKLLGCELVLNDNVQHRTEEWFATDDIDSIKGYLFAAPRIFWNGIKSMMVYRPTISGYTTTYNCSKQAYPFIQCIKSMLEFCDEVCVVDGGSTDTTFDQLVQLAYPEATVTTVEDLRAFYDDGRGGELPNAWHGVKRDPRLRIKVVPRDWSAKRHPVFDGMQKAAARAMCTKEFCWQMDSDEIVHEDDGQKIRELCKNLPKQGDIVSLPVIEYWGGPDKVRLDIQPWKWRLSRNRPYITHGIPAQLRRIDADGNPYAAEGTDGCDMIHKETWEPIPHLSFYTPDVENVRRAAMAGNVQAHQQYQAWFDSVVNNLPCVFHYSWYDLPRKIKLYRDYWQSHWNSLWDKDTSDTAQNNLMFGVPWSQVTDEMIEQRAAEMREKLGGWVWHRPWDGKAPTPHITCSRSQPKVMQ